MPTTTRTPSPALQKPWAKFLLPSAVGAALFLLPVPGGGTWTIPFGILIDAVNDNFGTLVRAALLAVTVSAALLTTWYSYGPAVPDRPLLQRHFRTSPAWAGLRLLGALFTVLYFTGSGPVFVTAEATGGAVIGTLMTNVLVLFALASFGLPLLTDYGFMEFVGTLLSRAFRTLFRLPGRSAIDGLASWLGAAALGVMLTVQQYDRGIYTKREAATVATSFSVVSMPFCYVVARLLELTGVFFVYYGSVMLIGFVCALVLPRIPPLTWLPDEYKPGTTNHVDPTVEPGEGLVAAGTRLALDRARHAPGVADFLRRGIDNLVFSWFVLVPVTVAIAMVSMTAVEYTSVFQWLSAPFVPVLAWAGIAEPAAAAPAFVVGFADMYLPALVGEGIASAETRFLVAILSVGQLVYMSEVGAILLRANLGLHVGHLAMIFALRTAIATPVALFIAHVVVF